MPYTIHRPTARVLDILQLLSTTREGCTLTEIATAISVPKSTIVPIIRTLCERRFITQRSTNKYVIGISSMIVGSACLQDMNILELFKTQMKRIVSDTSEACQLGVLVNGDVLYLAKEDSPEPIRLISFVGKRLPAYATSIGKALLSEYSQAEIRELYPQGLQPVTEQTCTDFEAFYNECQKGKKRGYFTDNEEISPGINCFSVPLTYRDRYIAAMSVSIPTFRLNKEKEELAIRSLKDSKEKLEQLFTELNINDIDFFAKSFQSQSLAEQSVGH